MGSCFGKLHGSNSKHREANSFTVDIVVSDEDAMEVLREINDMVLLDLKHSMPSAPAHSISVPA
jgi:hypothetical protein